MRLTPSDDDTLDNDDVKTGLQPALIGWGAATSVGHVRSRNEDAWGQIDCARFVVADGMGGRPGGDVAARFAVESFLHHSGSSGWITRTRQINDDLMHRTLGDPELDGAGTTLVALVIEEAHASVISVGDSRAYRLSSESLEQVTTDHNLKTLRDEGLVAADSGPERALTSFVGSSNSEQRIDVTTLTVERPTRILLCTDGVHGQIEAADIHAILLAGSCQDAAAALIAHADAAGGRDNATALVVDLDGVPKEEVA